MLLLQSNHATIMNELSAQTQTDKWCIAWMYKKA